MGYYDDQIRSLLSNPGGYSGTPGFTFARDQAMEAAGRQLAKVRGSGNAAAEMARLAAGYAGQDFGSHMDRLGRLSGQEQQFQLGTDANANTARNAAMQYALGLRGADTADTRAANDFTLGSRAAGTAELRAGNDFTLGQAQNANTAQANRWNFDLGSGRLAMDTELGRRAADTAGRTADSNALLGFMRAGNDLTLGREQNANTRQGNLFNYRLGNDRLRLDAAGQENTYNLANGRLGLDWYGAQTARGNARANDWWNDDASRRAWTSTINTGSSGRYY